LCRNCPVVCCRPASAPARRSVVGYQAPARAGIRTGRERGEHRAPSGPRQPGATMVGAARPGVAALPSCLRWLVRRSEPASSPSWWSWRCWSGSWSARSSTSSPIAPPVGCRSPRRARSARPVDASSPGGRTSRLPLGSSSAVGATPVTPRSHPAIRQSRPERGSSSDWSPGPGTARLRHSSSACLPPALVRSCSSRSRVVTRLSDWPPSPWRS